MTPINNKATEVRTWLRAIKDADGDVGVPDIKRHVARRWPDLGADVRRQIVDAVVGEGCG